MREIVRRAFVESTLRAFHTDPHMSEGRHAHEWRVRLYFSARPFRDGRAMKVALDNLLDAWRDRDLPAELWSADDLAGAVLSAGVLRLLGTGDPLGCEVWRADGPGGDAWWA